jgi:hypothetical protein
MAAKGMTKALREPFTADQPRRQPRIDPHPPALKTTAVLPDRSSHATLGENFLYSVKGGATRRWRPPAAASLTRGRQQNIITP